MKLLMGFIILLVALVAVTGCTQTTTEQTNATTVATTVAATEVTTAVTTVPAATATVVENVAAKVTSAAKITTTTAEVTTAATTALINVTPTATAANQVTKIHITSTGFTPQTDVVLPGTGVFFVNDDNVTHVVKATGNSTGMFNSGDILPGSGFTFSFSEKTGTYTYALDGNQSISGTIIVKAGRTLSG